MVYGNWFSTVTVCSIEGQLYKHGKQIRIANVANKRRMLCDGIARKLPLPSACVLLSISDCSRGNIDERENAIIL